MFQNAEGNKEIFKWPREIKGVRRKKKVGRGKKGERARVGQTRGGMRLTLYSGCAVISREESVQF